MKLKNKFGTVPLLVSLLVCITASFISIEVSGQDLQYSQFYATPLLINPAFAGTAPNTRIGLNYRNQWPNSAISYTSTSFFADNYFPYAKSGVGIQITQQGESLGAYSLTSFGASYSYLLKATNYVNVRLGLSGAYTLQNLNTSKLIFSDQLDVLTGDISPTSTEELNIQNVNYPDLAAGVLFYARRGWLGFSVSHLLEPSNSFLKTGASKIFRKYSVHLGWKFLLGRVYTKQQRPRVKDRSITPSLQYKIQGDFQQLDVGTTLTLEPIVFGLHYRGLPIATNSEADISNQSESIIAILGFTMPNPNILIGYSFDYPISNLSIGSGGSHEITVSYVLWNYRKKLPPRDVQKIPCPKF